MSLTPAQEHALAAHGNVLVSAGAGTGKTRTLVERCLGCLVSAAPPASLEEILVVTFTEAAAAEMRQRIRDRLQEELVRRPEVPRLAEQLALFETAQIGTLHSFCLRLIREHFYELELDPQLGVMAEEEARLLADETLHQLLREHYSGRAKSAEAVQRLIQAQGRGGDSLVRALVLRLHHYTQTRPDPAAWFQTQLDRFASPRPTLWREWLRAGLTQWREASLLHLDGLAAENHLARDCANFLRQLTADQSPQATAPILEKTLAAAETCPFGKKTLWREPLKGFIQEVEFLHSLLAQSGKTDPLDEDWGWVRHQMASLVELARDFSRTFLEAKRELGMVDFHDLEQYALRLLWEADRQQPSLIARRWRRQLRFVLVDEYQDINAAQDKIIRALSREDESSNRFLVGDVKQSIYRFRLADPTIFLAYLQSWRDTGGQVVPLVDNFRSREGLLHFVNSFCGTLMQPALSAIAYDDQARLRFGAPDQRIPLNCSSQDEPCVELHLRLKQNRNSTGQEEDTVEAGDELADLEEAEKEARLVALRLNELKTSRFAVWDEAQHAFRPVEWRDMAILLRAPANKAEGYAKEFSRLGIPLEVTRGGFYQSLEISDLLSLLRVLDNPLQDLPLLAVLRSPLIGLTLEDLATIRLAATKAPYWSALVRWLDAQRRQAAGQPTSLSSRISNSRRSNRNSEPPAPDTQDATLNESNAPPAAETFRKADAFLRRFGRWRRLARQTSLSQCLETILAETHYADWLLTQPRGSQRHTHVQRLLALTHRFDQFQRQGLFRFLRFVEAQQAAETEPLVEPLGQESSVRLMSIHQSKGQEFPVVVVADLAKPFNLADLRHDVILDEEYGLCPHIKPPRPGQRYPSLPYWLAQPRQLRQLLGEELRLLYVALTRARDRLILTASLPESRFRTSWQTIPEKPLAVLTSARSCADWLGLWFSQHCGAVPAGLTQGETAMLSWRLWNRPQLLDPVRAVSTSDAAMTSLIATPSEWRQLEQRLSWGYPFGAASIEPAKTSVTRVRLDAWESVEEAAVWPSQPSVPSERSGTQSKRSASEVAAHVGTAHHRFLQWVSLERVGSIPELQAEAQRLVGQSLLEADDVSLLDFGGLDAFWSSPLGVRIRAERRFVVRELAFTARFTRNELATLSARQPDPSLEHEFVVVQGVADLILLNPKEIWLIDFKTDHTTLGQAAERARSYQPQLRLYAHALARIHNRPVSGAWLCFLRARAAVAMGGSATHISHACD